MFTNFMKRGRSNVAEVVGRGSHVGQGTDLADLQKLCESHQKKVQKTETAIEEKTKKLNQQNEGRRVTKAKFKWLKEKLLASKRNQDSKDRISMLEHKLDELGEALYEQRMTIHKLSDELGSEKKFRQDLEVLIKATEDKLRKSVRASTQKFAAMICRGLGETYSNFIIKVMIKNPQTGIYLPRVFPAKSGPVLVAFHSTGADKEHKLEGTFTDETDLTGFQSFHAHIGQRRIYLEIKTDKEVGSPHVTIEGEIEDGPQGGQSFSGSGTWMGS